NANNENINFVYKIIRPNDGAVRWVNAIGQVYRDETEKLYRRVGVVHDITERKIAEENLAKSEQLLREAQRIGHIGHYELNIINGRMTMSEINDEIFGIDKDYDKTIENWLM